ncbi:MAG: YtxH domain-containing protein, partial [Eggerthellaceae bacterium]
AFSQKNDELRDKIEAARQRIASQVAQNAEAAHDAVSDTIPVAADAVQHAADAAKDKAEDAADAVAGDDKSQA